MGARVSKEARSRPRQHACQFTARNRPRLCLGERRRRRPLAIHVL